MAAPAARLAPPAPLLERLRETFARLYPQGTVCGLCGNFDLRSSNDFTTRDHMVVESELDFGNSWKEAPTCPDVTTTPEPCTQNPHRRSWSEKQCSIIKSDVFAACHSRVGGATSVAGVAVAVATSVGEGVAGHPLRPLCVRSGGSCSAESP